MGFLEGSRDTVGCVGGVSLSHYIYLVGKAPTEPIPYPKLWSSWVKPMLIGNRGRSL